MKPALKLQSRATGTEYCFFCGSRRRGASGRLLLVLDGDDQFEAAATAARTLQQAGAVPPLLPIGIGYGGGYRSPVNRRGRDYTPTRMKDEPMENGGAAAFLAFLREEAIPFLARHFDFPPGELGIGGHSLGSLFALYALAQPKPVFRYHLISSPSIWWDDRSVLKDVEAASAKPGGKTRAYVSVGTEDTPSMTDDLTLLEALLRKKPRRGMEYVIRRLPGKDHYNALPAAYEDGLAWLYAT